MLPSLSSDLHYLKKKKTYKNCIIDLSKRNKFTYSVCVCVHMQVYFHLSFEGKFLRKKNATTYIIQKKIESPNKLNFFQKRLLAQI